MVDQCGVTEAELSAKKEVFQQHSAGDTTIGFEEFRCASCEQIFLRTNKIFSGVYTGTSAGDRKTSSSTRMSSPFSGDMFYLLYTFEQM